MRDKDRKGCNRGKEETSYEIKDREKERVCKSAAAKDERNEGWNEDTKERKKKSKKREKVEARSTRW